MNRKKKLGWWKHIDFMLIDLLCIQIAYLAAYFFRHQTMRIYRETSLYAHVNILLIIIDICYVLLRGTCLLYTSDAADEEDSVDLGGRRITEKKKNNMRSSV